MPDQKLKKVLVLSDNIHLVRIFRGECLAQGVNEIATVDYRYSAINKNPGEMRNEGMSGLDIKNSHSVSMIKATYDLVFSLHCKQIFPPDLVNSVLCINIHPGFNPYNRGWYPQVFSILNGLPIGATIHKMDDNVDHGDIIDQMIVEIHSNDTSKDVYEKVIRTEVELIQNNLISIVNNAFSSSPPVLEGNYNSISDFKALCHLDLCSVGTLKEHIDLLRALTHGEFRNAYFTDEHRRKTFVRIFLEEDV